MAAPPAQRTFVELLLKSRLVTETQLHDLFPDAADQQNPQTLAEGLVKAGLLTRYQVQMLQAGKHRGFFLGPYKILRPLGQGGMGAVFLAEHTGLSRKVAVKVLPPDKAKDQLTLERFQREARAAAALDHPNIVRLHDISQGNGVHFLVMEFVDGTDLQSLMGQTGPLHYAQAAQYVAQAAAGLQHAHEKGFIHRDIKPGNLMLTKTGGSIKILDMGLARSFTDAADSITANLAEGDIAGTIDYLSPEQAMNQSLDERSDIYSLGVTLYALVAGHPPFKGTTAQKLMQHQLKEPPSVSSQLQGRVPQALSDVIHRMMAKKPSERYQTMLDVIDALGPWLPVPSSGNIIIDPMTQTSALSDQTWPNRRSSRVKVPPADGKVRWAWKRLAVLAGGMAALLLLVGGAIAAIALNGGDAPPTKPNPHTASGGVSSTVAGGSFTFDAGTVSPFRRVGQTMEQNGTASVSLQFPGISTEVYDSAGRGNFIAIGEGADRALGVAATGEKCAAQLAFRPHDLPADPIVDGKQYIITLEYRTDPGVNGLASVQTMNDWKTIGGLTLTDTAGEWKTSTFPMTRPPGQKIQLTVGPKQANAGYVWVRKISVFPENTTTESRTPPTPGP
ncbi:MAG: serine/threonine protein kinase [Fimbriiglobus sp.]|nr:serine/threonine protein kinase [Fimbriiglobus sp.]